MSVYVENICICGKVFICSALHTNKLTRLLIYILPTPVSFLYGFLFFFFTLVREKEKRKTTFQNPVKRTPRRVNKHQIMRVKPTPSILEEVGNAWPLSSEKTRLSMPTGAQIPLWNQEQKQGKGTKDRTTEMLLDETDIALSR